MRTNDPELNCILDEIDLGPPVEMRSTQRHKIVAGGKPHRSVDGDPQSFPGTSATRGKALRNVGDAPHDRASSILDGESNGQIVKVTLDKQNNRQAEGGAGLDERLSLPLRVQ